MTMQAERRPDDENDPETGGAGTDAQERDPEIGPGSHPDADRGEEPNGPTPGGRR